MPFMQLDGSSKSKKAKRHVKALICTKKCANTFYSYRFVCTPEYSLMSSFDTNKKKCMDVPCGVCADEIYLKFLSLSEVFRAKQGTNVFEFIPKTNTVVPIVAQN